MLERRVVMRTFVADRADNAGLVVGKLRDGDAGRPAERRAAAFRRHDKPAVDAGTARDADGGAVLAPLHLGRRRCEHVERGERVHPCVQ